MSAENVQHLAADDVRYSHDHIPAKGFANPGAKMTMHEVVYAVLEGLMSVMDMPPVRVFDEGGVWYSPDNRRLWVMKNAGVLNACMDEGARAELVQKRNSGANGISMTVLAPSCTACGALFRFGGSPEFSAHVAKEHIGCELDAVRAVANASTCPKHGPVGVEFTKCSLKSKCKRQATGCSNKYPCREALASLKCGCHAVKLSAELACLSLPEVFEARRQLAALVAPDGAEITAPSKLTAETPGDDEDPSGSLPPLERGPVTPKHAATVPAGSQTPPAAFRGLATAPASSPAAASSGAAPVPPVPDPSAAPAPGPAARRLVALCTGHGQQEVMDSFHCSNKYVCRRFRGCSNKYVCRTRGQLLACGCFRDTDTGECVAIER